MPSLTYAELAELLKITPASANKLARRRRWPRVPGNDGKARVSVPEEALVRRDSPPDSPPDVPSVSPQDVPPPSPPDNLIKALEAHVTTLREQLAAADTRLAAADAREAQYVADLAAERAQTAKAIEAFVAIADKLDQLAAERARPWWRRLAG
jgi:hypothetical protein